MTTHYSSSPTFKRFKYNSALEMLHKMDVVFGLHNGVPHMIKNRYGGINESISLTDCVSTLIQLLSVKTTIDFFDDALKEELTEAVCKIVDRHAVKHRISVYDILKERLVDG
ncbi:hypothetical protein KAR91_82220 [Candidatus Pacearchaeota archaeon]|nr:hypothetical protein [Candidatus Pacearchaeota archaeon]